MSVSPPGNREVAHRVFAAEFNAADLEHASSDEERAPKYLVLPSGVRVNRCFIVGVLTEVEWVNDDVVRARVVDPTGAFVVYAGQYQPEALAFLESAEPPAFVAVTGKANTFQPDGSDRVFTSIRPEQIGTVDPATRDRWTVQAAEHTLERIDRMAAAMTVDASPDRSTLIDAGYSPTIASGIALALSHYGTTSDYLGALRSTALNALRLVAGERDTVEPPDIAPDRSTGTVSISSLRLADGFTPASSEPSPEPTAAESADSTPDDPPTDIEAEPSFELDPAEREAVEAEYGTEFSTGAEVGTAEGDDRTDSDAHVDVPDTADAVEPDSAEPTETVETGSDTTTDPSDDEPTEDAVDVESAVIEVMTEISGDDGAERTSIVETVMDRYGVDESTVEGALESALLSGRCYEPQDDVFKPI